MLLSWLIHILKYNFVLCLCILHNLFVQHICMHLLVNNVIVVGMAQNHYFGFGTRPECNTSVSILNRYHRGQITSLKRYVSLKTI